MAHCAVPCRVNPSDVLEVPCEVGILQSKEGVTLRGNRLVAEQCCDMYIREELLASDVLQGQ
jgi:hypothetical protein